MIRQKIRKVTPSPKTSAKILTEAGGSTTQVRFSDGAHFPDHALTPVVLFPLVTWSDAGSGKKSENAAAELTDGHWYRLDRDNSGIGPATELDILKTGLADDGVTTVNLYDIDKATGSDTYGRLTIRENFEPDKPAVFVFIAKMSDGSTVSCMQRLDASAMETPIPSICFDNNPLDTYNPLADARYFTIKPFLAPDGYTATWSWESYHEGKWGALKSTRFDWAVDKDGDGIKIDREYMQQELWLRVKAVMVIDGQTVTLTKEVSHTRVMPSLDQYSEITCVGDVPAGTTSICPHAAIRTEHGPVDDESEVLIAWYVDNGTTPVAYGQDPVIPYKEDMEIGMTAVDAGGWCAATDNNGVILTDPNDGKTLLIRNNQFNQY